MARLPQPGGDNGNWGDILNDYLSQSHETDGTLRPDSVSSTQIADNSITETLLAPAVQTKLNQTAPTWSTLAGKPVVVAAGNDQTAARAAVGAFATSDVIDEDTMISNSVAKVPTQQSVKAYVDTQINGVVNREIVLARGYAPQVFSNDTQFLVGADIYVDATNGPVDLTLDLGLIVFGAGTPGESVEFELFIRDAATNETFAYNIFASPPLQSNGFIAAKPPAMTARLLKGTPLARYVGVVSGQGTNNVNPVTITLNPSWAPEGTTFVSLKAERV